MRTVDAYLTRKAQAVWPAAVVTQEGGQVYRLRPSKSEEEIGLGATFRDAKAALLAMIAAEKTERKAAQ